MPTALPDELQVRFHVLKAEYQFMLRLRPVPDVVAPVRAIRDENATLADLFVLERAYSAILDHDFVTGAIQNWRQTYRSIVGDAKYAD